MKGRADLVPVTAEGITAAYALAVNLVMWWHECGVEFYGKKVREHWRLEERNTMHAEHGRLVNGPYMVRVHYVPKDTAGYDPGLEGFCNEAARVIGGWRSVRRLIADTPPSQRTERVAAFSRGILLRDPEDGPDGTTQRDPAP